MASAEPLERPNDDLGSLEEHVELEPSSPVEANKPKGRKRLMQTLHRLKSSPSLSKLARSTSGLGPSPSYRTQTRGSVSVVSLSSPPLSPDAHYGSSYSINFPNAFSTAPTSLVSTPSIETPAVGPARPRARTLGSRPSQFLSFRSAPCPPELTAPSPLSAGFVGAGDYFSRPITKQQSRKLLPRRLDLWKALPFEVRLQIFQYLEPREIVRCSAVSRSWHKMCFDGQLWARLDTTQYYRDIPAKSLVKIITAAGPFVKDLNLRGCIQLWESWRASGLLDACHNIENISLEGCRIDRSSIHSLLHQNARLQHINLSGLMGVSNSTMRIIAQNCPNVSFLNISWCTNVDAKGLRRVVESCSKLSDLRAGEVQGFDDEGLLAALFAANTLERLVLQHCDSLTDNSLRILFTGPCPEMDCLTGRPLVPSRVLRHLDVSRCCNITDEGIAHLAHHVPHLEGLQLSRCHGLGDGALLAILPTLHRLTHLDLEELDQLTNAPLIELARSPCRLTLQHLNLSSCDALGDAGMLPVVKECRALRNLDLDNTRVSDLVLAEAAAMIRHRSATAARAHVLTSPTSMSLPLLPSQMRTSPASAAALKAATTHAPRPVTGLMMSVYDCQNVTWTGIREVMSRNAEPRRPATFSIPATTLSPPHEIIALKVFYGYQPTVAEHTRRVLRGDLAAASRLERKWAEYMMANEEVAAGGPGGGRGFDSYGNRRRRRRAREAANVHADEEGVGDLGDGTAWGVGPGLGRRRRGGRGGGSCSVM